MKRGDEEATFRLSVRIGTELSETDTQELRRALADSGSEYPLTRKDTRSGVIWKIDLGRADRPEHLIERLVGLEDSVARTIARITHEEEVVYVSLCQEIDDTEDTQQKGIWFTRDAVRWASLAGATIDIDQYIYID